MRHLAAFAEQFFTVSKVYVEPATAAEVAWKYTSPGREYSLVISPTFVLNNLYSE